MALGLQTNWQLHQSVHRLVNLQTVRRHVKQVVPAQMYSCQTADACETCIIIASRVRHGAAVLATPSRVDKEPSVLRQSLKQQGLSAAAYNGPFAAKAVVQLEGSS